MVALPLPTLSLIGGFILALWLTLFPGNDTAIRDKLAHAHMLEDCACDSIIKTKQAVNSLAVELAEAPAIL